MRKTKEECLLNQSLMSYDLGKNESRVMEAMEEYATDAVKQFEGAKIPKGFNGNFASALHWLKDGNKVCRNGWNGKGIWLKYINPDEYQIEVKLGHPLQAPFIGIHTAQNTFEVGWRPTTMDMLAEDWMVTDQGVKAE